jgi:hypothetical protein
VEELHGGQQAVSARGWPRRPHDKTTGIPVTNFKRSNTLYATAVKFNKGLDRDKDGIACETA